MNAMPPVQTTPAAQSPSPIMLPAAGHPKSLYFVKKLLAGSLPRRSGFANQARFGQRRFAYTALLGRRQAVRHRFLVPAFPGSNPGAPAIYPQVKTVSADPGDRTDANYFHGSYIVAIGIRHGFVENDIKRFNQHAGGWKNFRVALAFNKKRRASRDTRRPILNLATMP